MSTHAIAAVNPLEALGSALFAWTGHLTSTNELTLSGTAGKQRIASLPDASGRRHHFRNHELPQRWRPAYQEGYAIAAGRPGGPWQTHHAVIGLDAYADGERLDGNVLYQKGSLYTTASFYLAAAFANIRQEGAAPLWGTSAEHNVILDQGLDQVFFTLDGEVTEITDPGAVAKGAVILEIYRVTTAGEIQVRVNGVTKSATNARVVGSTRISGWGYDGVAPWRGPLFELVMSDKPTGLVERKRVRRWLSEKWGIPV